MRAHGDEVDLPLDRHCDDRLTDPVSTARFRGHGGRWPLGLEARDEPAEIAVSADAALFCAVHDILQSPGALRNVLGKLRPGAWVAAGGGKWAAPLMVAVNMQVRTLHAPYVRSFDGFDRPWNHLEQLIEGVHVDEVGFGGGYIATGRVPQRASA